MPHHNLHIVTVDVIVHYEQCKPNVSPQTTHSWESPTRQACMHACMMSLI